MVRRIGVSAAVVAALILSALAGCDDDETSPSIPFTLDSGFDTSSPQPDVYTPPVDSGSQPDVVDSASPVDANEAAAPLPGIHVSLTGDDMADGSEAKPVKTIKKAAELVVDGQAIYLTDGTYDSTTQSDFSLALSKTVTVIGTGSGKVTIAGNASGSWIFNKGGGVSGVTIKDQSTAISVTGGTFTVSDIVFDHVATPMIIAGNTVATITLPATFLKNPNGSSFTNFLATDGTSDVTVTGGTMASLTGIGHLVLARGSSTLTLNGMTVTNWNWQFAHIYDNAKVTVNDSTFDAVGPGGGPNADNSVFAMGGQNTAAPLAEALTLKNTKITNSKGNAVGLSLYGNMASHDVLTFTDSQLDKGAHAVLVSTPGNLDSTLTVGINATNTTFDGNSNIAIDVPRATISLTGGSVSTNTQGGIIMRTTADTQSLEIRGTKFATNGGHAISVDGAAATVVDLGKAGDAGGIVFSGVPAGSSALNLLAKVAASALGNTWMPNENGADAAGKFTATVLTGPTSGKNATLVSGSSVAVGP